MRRRLLVAVAISLLFLVPLPAATGMSQIVFFNSITNTFGADTTKRFMPPMTFFAPSSTEANQKGLWCASGNMTNLQVTLGTAPGGAFTRTSTLRQGANFGAMGDSSLTCAISAAGTTCTDNHVVAVNGGDYLDLSELANNSSAQATTKSASVEFQSTNTGESCVSGMVQSNVPNLTGTANFINPHGIQSSWLAANTNMDEVMPMAGQITGLYIGIGTAPGASSKQWTFSVEVNGSNQTTTNVVITDPSVSGSETSSTVAVSAGDRYSIRALCTTTNCTSPVTVYWSIKLTATTNGQSVYGGTTNNTALTSNGTDFTTACCVGGPPGTQTTEANAGKVYGGTTGFTLQNFYVYDTAGDPGSGKAYTGTMQKNGSGGTTTVTCTFTGNGSTGVSCNDPTHTYSITSTDYLSTAWVAPASPGTAAKVTWGAQMFIAPAVSATATLGLLGVGK